MYYYWFGVVYKSTDGGNNWVPKIDNPYNNNLFYDFIFFNNFGYMVGTSGQFIKTSDYGENWYNASCSYSGNINSLSFINTNTGWIAGDNGAIDLPPIFWTHRRA